MNNKCEYLPIAQMVERRTVNPSVMGSSPIRKKIHLLVFVAQLVRACDC